MNDSEGIRLTDLVWNNLADWGEHIPYDYEGDDGAGYSICRETFDDQVASVARKLVFYLENSGRNQTARHVETAFNAMALQCSAMDDWCAGNPCPQEVALYWPSDVVFEAVGDENLKIWSRCFGVLRDLRTTYKPKEGGADPPPGLNECEAAIYQAIQENGRLKGESLAEKAGYPYNSNLKTTLSGMKKRGVIINHGRGYCLPQSQD